MKNCRLLPQPCYCPSPATASALLLPQHCYFPSPDTAPALLLPQPRKKGRKLGDGRRTSKLISQGGDRQTDMHIDIATTRLTQPRGRSQLKVLIFKSLYISFNIKTEIIKVSIPVSISRLVFQRLNLNLDSQNQVLLF